MRKLERDTFQEPPGRSDVGAARAAFEQTIVESGLPHD